MCVGVLSLRVLSQQLLRLGVLSLLEFLQVPHLGGSLALHRSCASGLLAAGDSSEELLELRALPLEPRELVLLELLELEELLELVVLQELELAALELVLLELELLEVQELVVLRELELETLELGELVQSLLVQKALRGRGRTSLHYFSRF
ncbi:unnamed protein product [Closterium sp. NIES-64]|nr:unnamed protein product [Closterium sp. NIES-64]